jgi:uncharacterized radical SAM protein YgiQ
MSFNGTDGKNHSGTGDAVKGFIPTSRKEMEERGWDSLDIILVSGDTYYDTPYSGSAMIGRWLMHNGYRVGIIPQPSQEDIGKLGIPELFWSVSAGCVDSMVANRTANNKKRRHDDFTPGGRNERRPDRATIVYTNMIKRFCKDKPIVLGGIEASLRRIAHYDGWTDTVRRSVLFDAKADYITYGMAEFSNLELANALRDSESTDGIRGICYISGECPDDHIAVPSYEECLEDTEKFTEAYLTFSENCDPVTAKGLCQKHGNRFLVQNPPQRDPTTEELDLFHSLGYMNEVHPSCIKDGYVKAADTIKNSVTTHRGCYGGCSFCAIAVHQGRRVISRSEDSIVKEVEEFAKKPGFNGIIYDLGGPTANMYGIECEKKITDGACEDRGCLFPYVCESLNVDHGRQIRLLERVLDVEGVRKVFVTSGIRYDMILADEKQGKAYVDAIVKDHVSGQLKIAPEHVSDDVLKLMGKPGRKELLEFKRMFDSSNREHNKRQFLTYYTMAAHPGCTQKHMENLGRFCRTVLKTNPEQVQIFTPTPSTVSTLMYHTGKTPEGDGVFVERSAPGKQRQKNAVLGRRGNAGK